MSVSDIRVVDFKIESTNMFVTNQHNDPEFIEFDFLKKTHKATTGTHVSLREKPHGIPSEKSDIITKLLPLMPTTCHAFWNSLKTTENAVDLLTSDEY